MFTSRAWGTGLSAEVEEDVDVEFEREPGDIVSMLISSSHFKVMAAYPDLT